MNGECSIKCIQCLIVLVHKMICCIYSNAKYDYYKINLISIYMKNVVNKYKNSMINENIQHLNILELKSRHKIFNKINKEKFLYIINIIVKKYRQLYMYIIC